MSKFSNRFAERLEATAIKAGHAWNALDETTRLTAEWEAKQQTFTGTIKPIHERWQSRIRQILSRPVKLTDLDRQLALLASYRYPMWRNPIVLSFRVGNGRRRVQINALRVWNILLTIVWFVIDNLFLIISVILILALLWWVASNWSSITQTVSDLLDSIQGTTP